MDKLDLDRKRAVIDVLLRVTILPGQRRGELRTELLPITWKGLKMIALKVIWFIVLMFFTLVVAALGGWLVAGIACVLAREVLLAATAEIPQLATTVGGVGNFPSSTPTSTLTDAEIATLEAEAEAAVP
ncbi:MAG: hypothetical protein QOI39_2496 [Mycobacterium sp.]|nr:hypothetical protein [Mycobacterium sp.]